MENVRIDEVMNNETVNEVAEVATEVSTGGNIGKIMIGVGITALAAVGAWAYKNRDRLEQKRVEKLRKKGYIILEPKEGQSENIEEMVIDEIE